MIPTYSAKLTITINAESKESLEAAVINMKNAVAGVKVVRFTEERWHAGTTAKKNEDDKWESLL